MLVETVIRDLQNGTFIPVEYSYQNYLMHPTGNIVGATDVWAVDLYFGMTTLYRGEKRVPLSFKENFRLWQTFRTAMKAEKKRFKEALRS